MVNELESKLNGINPFHDFGINSFEQFEKYPFLVFGSLKDIEYRIKQQIAEIKAGHTYGERLYFVAEKGIGKTSTLFFIKELLELQGIECLYFSRLVENRDSLLSNLKNTLAKKYLSTDLLDLKFNEISKNLFSKPTYLLIDFPDSYDLAGIRKFFMFMWNLVNSEDSNRINLIFAMNEKHIVKINSSSNSELLGKFISTPLQRLNIEETKELIQSRLNLVQNPKTFSEEVLELIFKYSKGIPRNIVSACNLLYASLGGTNLKNAETLLRDKYTDQVIDDRVESLELRRTYKQMVLILKQDFNCCADSQELYISKIREVLGLGRNLIMKHINELNKQGVFSLTRGGYNRTKKIISLGGSE